METSKRINHGREYWRAHITAAQSYSGTAGEYCQENGLSKSTFQRYKRELGFARRGRKTREAAFAKVITGTSPVEKREAKISRRLPDPTWVAEVLIAMAGER